MRPAAHAHDCRVGEWRCTRALDAAAHEAVRREMALHAFKWDTQIGDVATLAPFALVIPASVGAHLASLAESLAAELGVAEQALLARPDLWPKLGLPRRICRALGGTDPWTPAAARAMRFDFHPTAQGWRISEVNSDVPGGYTESAHFPRLMADLAVDARLPGDPLAALTAALAAHAHRHGRIALLAAPGYTEDQQVAACIAAALEARGIETTVARPEQIAWRERKALLGGAPVDAIFRFFQGEWMTRLHGDDWRALFRGGLTPVCNPAAAMLSESKRLPLTRGALGLATPTWDELLPATSPASRLLTARNHDDVLKPAYGNTGDDIAARAWTKPADFRRSLACALMRPKRWLAQARFETVALATPLGRLHPCLGVYVINGCAAGIYGRLTAGPLIDFAAIDTAVLIAHP